MKRKNKGLKRKRNFAKPLTSLVLVILSGISFGLFIKEGFPKIFLFIFVFLLIWIGFSFFLLKVYKGKFSYFLIKDSLSFLPFFFLPPLWSIIKNTGLPNLTLYQIFLLILALSTTIFLKATLIKPLQIKDRIAFILLCISIFIYISVYSFLSFLNYKNLSIMKIGDFALFNQVFWYTINGKILHSQILGYNFLGEHFSPIIIVLAPFYFFFPNPLTLLILQTIIIGIGAIPLYLLVKDKFKDSLLALSFSLAYLLYPMTGRVNLLEFHEIIFCMPSLLFTFYFLLKKRWVLYFLFVFLSLMVKENISIIIAFLGLYILFFKKERKTGLITAVIGLSWAYLSVKVLIPYIREITSAGEFSGYAHLGKYGILGKTFSEILINLLFHPQKIVESLSFDRRLIMFNNILYLIVPFGFLPLLSILTILAIPEFLLQSLSSISLQYILVSSYSAPIIPILMVSSLYGIANIIRIFPFIRRYIFSFSVYIFFSSLLSNYYFSFPAFVLPTDVVNYEFKHHKTILSIPLNKESYQIPEKAKIFFKIRDLIPQGFSVSASSPESVYLSCRKTIIPLDEFQKTDSLILNTSPSTWADMDLINKTLEMALKNKDFRLIFNKKGIYLFVKNGKERDILSQGLKLPPSAQIFFIISSIYYNLGEIDKAIIYSKKAKELYLKKSNLYKEEISELHYDLAKYYYEKRDLLKSYYELKEVIRLSPDNIQARENLEAIKKILNKNQLK